MSATAQTCKFTVKKWSIITCQETFSLQPQREQRQKKNFSSEKESNIENTFHIFIDK